jgi:hypothetical protein
VQGVLDCVRLRISMDATQRRASRSIGIGCLRAPQRFTSRQSAESSAPPACSALARPPTASRWQDRGAPRARLAAQAPSRRQSASKTDPLSASKTDPPSAVPRRPRRAFRGVRRPGPTPRAWVRIRCRYRVSWRHRLTPASPGSSGTGSRRIQKNCSSSSAKRAVPFPSEAMRRRLSIASRRWPAPASVEAESALPGSTSWSPSSGSSPWLRRREITMRAEAPVLSVPSRSTSTGTPEADTFPASAHAVPTAAVVDNARPRRLLRTGEQPSASIDAQGAGSSPPARV